MHKRDRRLADIGQGLGYSNLKTTSDYLEEQRGYICAHTRGLEDEFGIEAAERERERTIN